MNKLVVGLVTGVLTGLPVSAADNSYDYEVWDTRPDTWVAVDELGRTVASSDAGVDRAQKDPNTAIGMFYYVWHGAERPTSKDITELLKADPDNPDWGPVNYYHWGYKPWLGYYKGGDAYVVAKHMQMMVDAGVDFIFLDNTNAQVYLEPTRVILDELQRRHDLGLRYPRVAFMVNAESAQTVNRIYNFFYRNKPENDKFWFYYEGKPLMLARESDMNKDEVKEFFTFRYSWAWLQGKNENEWAWLEYYPQKPGWHYETNPATGGTRKVTEQISVSVAQHATTKVGKSYHGGKQPAIDKYGMCAETPQGLYFQEQWDEAIRVHPPLVMVTQFNEWIAMRQLVTASNLNDTRPGATKKVGESYFVDVYNAEFSRDLEPSTHPSIRDNYYLQMVSNARKYRGVEQIPVPTRSLTIDIRGSFDQWDEETLEFLDDKGDAFYTSTDAQSATTLTRATNDIIRCKVTKNADTYFFYVETAEPISDPATTDRWMKLLLNTDGSYTTGWYGYNFIVRKNASGDYVLQRNTMANTYSWSTVEKVDYRVEGCRMHLAIPRKSLNDYGKNIDIDFKWADNTPDGSPDIMRFISDGDCAPNGRFNYRYKGSTIVGVGGAEAPEASAAQPAVTTGQGTLTVSVPDADSSMEVTVVDPVGRVVATGRAGRTITLPSGLYIVTWRGTACSGSVSALVR
ncbi:MAG: hypothetical protein K2K36_04890 [Muribaculaceae bacterium]|nr:hypothetical protein [Muribaculaceae bacterium]